jgi:hypothetical protein
MAKDNGSDGDREPTLRVVLRRELAIVLTDLTDEQRAEVLKAVAAVKVRGIPKDVAAPRETWAVMAQVNGASKLNAIEAYAGKAGTPDAKPGAYRAPTAKAWAGGEEYVKPPEPKVERRSLA